MANFPLTSDVREDYASIGYRTNSAEYAKRATEFDAWLEATIIAVKAECYNECKTAGATEMFALVKENLKPLYTVAANLEKGSDSYRAGLMAAESVINDAERKIHEK